MFTRAGAGRQFNLVPGTTVKIFHPMLIVNVVCTVPVHQHTVCLICLKMIRLALCLDRLPRDSLLLLCTAIRTGSLLFYLWSLAMCFCANRCTPRYRNFAPNYFSQSFRCIIMTLVHRSSSRIVQVTRSRGIRGFEQKDGVFAYFTMLDVLLWFFRRIKLTVPRPPMTGVECCVS